MLSMARNEKVSIELKFIRSGEGRSRRAKIKSFWEFIDARKELVPLNPAQDDAESNMNQKNPSVCRKSDKFQGCDYRESESEANIPSKETTETESRSDFSDVCNHGDQLTSQRRIWYDELRIFKQLGLDSVALVASDACKRCLKDERYNVDKEPEFADSVAQPYDELAADLRAFQERIKHQKPKFAYKDPGKYGHMTK